MDIRLENLGGNQGWAATFIYADNPWHMPAYTLLPLPWTSAADYATVRADLASRFPGAVINDDGR